MESPRKCLPLPLLPGACQSFCSLQNYNFKVSQNPKTLKQAMSSYTQAEKDIVSRSSPELHYNKVRILRVLAFPYLFCHRVSH